MAKVDDVRATLDRAAALERSAGGLEGDSELVIEAVLLCAGKVQDLTAPDSVHFRAAERIVRETDIGTRDALRRMRGVLRAAAQLEGLLDDLHDGI